MSYLQQQDWLGISYLQQQDYKVSHVDMCHAFVWLLILHNLVIRHNLFDVSKWKGEGGELEMIPIQY